MIHQTEMCHGEQARCSCTDLPQVHSDESTPGMWAGDVH